MKRLHLRIALRENCHSRLYTWLVSLVGGYSVSINFVHCNLLSPFRLDESLTRSRKSREQRQNTLGNPGSVAKSAQTAFLDDTSVPSCIHGEPTHEEEFKFVLVSARDKIESQENIAGTTPSFDDMHKKFLIFTTFYF